MSVEDATVRDIVSVQQRRGVTSTRQKGQIDVDSVPFFADGRIVAAGHGGPPTMPNRSVGMRLSVPAHQRQPPSAVSRSHAVFSCARQVDETLMRAAMHGRSDAVGMGEQADTEHLLDFGQIPVHPGPTAAILPKLKIGARGDRFEQEADEVADQVMAMSQPRRECGCGGTCPACISPETTAEAAVIRTKPAGQVDARETNVPSIVHDALLSTGNPLGRALRSFMEPRFGQGFGDVRIHTDPVAASSAAALGARAFTSGHHVLFAAGEFQPETDSGRRLIAHELAHVAQQRTATARPGTIQKTPDDSVEGAEDEVEPSAEEVAGEMQHSESLRDRIHGKFWTELGRVSAAQSVQPAERRQKWIDAINAKANKVEEIIARKDSVGVLEIAPLDEFLTKINAEVDAEVKVAEKLWQNANDRYTNERIRLEDEGEYRSELALKYLDQAFDEREPRISKLIEIDALVQEDVLGLVHVLDNRLHIKTATIVADRERADAQERLDRLSEVPDEGPGFLATAWSIVGCDSIGECLGDAALTVATAGAGKALKFVVKGAKAAKKANKARKVVRSAKQLGSTLHKLMK